jgi:hypothetical protein
MRPSFLGHLRYPTDPVERPTPPHPPVGGNGPSADCRCLAPVGGYAWVQPRGLASRAGEEEA